MARRRKPRKPTASAALPIEAMELMEIIGINRAKGTALLDDGETELDLEMMDADGEATDDGELAVAAVVCFGDDLWVTLDLTMWEKPTLH